jgi:hypothetical protein
VVQINGRDGKSGEEITDNGNCNLHRLFEP